MKKKSDNLFNDELFLEFQEKKFINSSFKKIFLKGVNRQNNYVEYVISIEEKQGKKILNCFDYPIDLENLTFTPESYKKIVNEIKKISINENISNIYFKKKISDEELKKKLLEKDDTLDFIGVESSINLNNDLEFINKNFSKGHRSSLKIMYKNLKYELFDYKNYQKDLVLEMMNLHKEVSGRTTRSTDTWRTIEKMILNKKGLLIKVKDDVKIISFAFIFFNNKSAVYFSSCTLREMFKLYKNITHKTIWESIKYLKSINCKSFYLGITKTHYSRSITDKKNKNIDLFKSSFGGEKSNFIIYNNLENIKF